MEETNKVFHRVPPEVWESVLLSIGKRDLAALALTSRFVYPFANALLYKVIELSFCKCSETYYQRLARTVTNCAELARHAKGLLIDMKIVCGVKGISSMENMKDTVRTRWQRRMENTPFNSFLVGRQQNKPSTETEWNKEAVQTLRGKYVAEILSCLTGLEEITIILGRFVPEDDILSLLLTRIPEESLSRIRSLRLGDIPLNGNKSLTYLSSLRVLELSYIAVKSRDLWAVLQQNSLSLERLSLHWIMEPSHQPIFTDCTHCKLPNLKAFSTRGPHTFSSEAMMELLDNCSLEELGMESLAAQASHQWVLFLDFLTSCRTSKQIHTIKFGIPTGCTIFWESAARFISSCSGTLYTISINGSSRGPSARLPAALQDCLTNLEGQHCLTTSILIWRDDFGIEDSIVQALQCHAPNIEFLHVYLRFPLADEINRLLELTASFGHLRYIHFVFPTRLTDGDGLYQAAVEKLKSDIEKGSALFDRWARKASAQHPHLREVSWSTYDRMSFAIPNPSVYKKIDRGFNATIDLGKEYRDIQDSPLFGNRCTVGSKKVLLKQRASWREDMGNPFHEEHRACQYAEFTDPGQSTKRLMEL